MSKLEDLESKYGSLKEFTSQYKLLIENYIHNINFENISVAYCKELEKKYQEIIEKNKEYANLKKEYIELKKEDNESILLKKYSFDENLNYSIEELRASIFRLLKKLESEDASFKNSFKELRKEFLDLKRRNEILEEEVFLQNKQDVKNKIISFKREYYSLSQCIKLLKEISKKRLYIEEYVMFDFLLYLNNTFGTEIEILNSLPRYSYEYFKENKNRYDDQIMLTDIFSPSGFSMHRTKDETLISFEELNELIYTSCQEKISQAVDKYKEHENSIYLYYALSKNLSLDENNALKIYTNLSKLGLFYPYSQDINNMVFSIKGTIERKHRVNKTNDLKQEKKIKKVEFNEIFIYDGFEYLLVEERARIILANRSKSIYSYMESIDEFLFRFWQLFEYMEKNKVNLKDDENIVDYAFYILEVLSNDYRLNYYENHYLESVVNISDLDIKNYEFKLFIFYMSIQSNMINLLNLILNIVDCENKILYIKTIYLEKFKIFRTIFDDSKKYEVYFDLAEYLKGIERDIYLDFRLIKAGYKINYRTKKKIEELESLKEILLQRLEKTSIEYKLVNLYSNLEENLKEYEQDENDEMNTWKTDIKYFFDSTDYIESSFLRSKNKSIEEIKNDIKSIKENDEDFFQIVVYFDRLIYQVSKSETIEEIYLEDLSSLIREEYNWQLPILFVIHLKDVKTLPDKLINEIVDEDDEDIRTYLKNNMSESFYDMYSFDRNTLKLISIGIALERNKNKVDLEDLYEATSYIYFIEKPRLLKKAYVIEKSTKYSDEDKYEKIENYINEAKKTNLETTVLVESVLNEIDNHWVKTFTYKESKVDNLELIQSIKDGIVDFVSIDDTLDEFISFLKFLVDGNEKKRKVLNSLVEELIKDDRDNEKLKKLRINL